jgi:diguanylate cyclase (GGDEF)-like protein
VIFVTARSDPADETLALETGGVDFITRPVNPAVVRARVKTHLTLKAQSDFLRSLAFIDGLTGLANRRRFDEALVAEWRHCRRRGVQLALLMIDIDHFKRYNDHYGHLAGDACLRRVAAALRACLGRAHDLVARYGGEEFACLIPECDAETALARAGEIRTALKLLAIPHATSPTADRVTLSIGVACFCPGADDEPERLVTAADAALYEAKSRGRDRVELSPAGHAPAAPETAARSGEFKV